MRMFEAWQEALLAEARVGRLGTIAADGRPRLVPVCYALVDRDVAIAVDEKPKRPGRLARLRDLDRDPRATLLVDHWDEDWSRLAWVRVEAEGQVLGRGEERPDALEALRDRYPQYRNMALEGLPLILLRPVRVSGWQAKSAIGQ